MKKLFIISFLLLVGLNGFSQDTTKVYWDNGNLKYLEYLSCEPIKNSIHYDHKAYFNVSEFYNEYGVKLTQEEFVNQFGSELIDSLNIYKEEQIKATERQHKINYPTEYNYTELIRTADNYFGNREFKKAYDYYKKALEIKPKEGYPKNKLLELEVIKKEKQK